MNLLLLTPQDITDQTGSSGKAKILRDDRRFKHLASILKINPGSNLKVGVLGGQTGEAKVESASDEQFELNFFLDKNSPLPLPVKLIVALPRPKVVLRVLQSATTLGVKEIYLVNAYKVEKAFWSCEQLKEGSINKALLLGLEQARDTVLPSVSLERRLKPFVEDRLDMIARGTNRIVAHPVPGSQRCGLLEGPQTIVIGPEGGFIEYELEMFKACGFTAVSLGERILKSETAMVAILSLVQNS